LKGGGEDSLWRYLTFTAIASRQSQGTVLLLQHDFEESFKLKRNLLFSILALVAGTLVPLAASCQIVIDKPPAPEKTEKTYKWEAYAGYGYTSLNQVNQVRYGLQGVNASLTRDFGKYFGLTADGSYYFKAIQSGNPVNAKVYLALAGPVFHVDLYSRYSGFARVLIGGAHTGGAGEIPNISFAGGIGAGLDYKLSQHFSLRASGDDITSSFVAPVYLANPPAPNQPPPAGSCTTNSGCTPHEHRNSRAEFGVVYKF